MSGIPCGTCILFSVDPFDWCLVISQQTNTTYSICGDADGVPHRNLLVVLQQYSIQCEA